MKQQAIGHGDAARTELDQVRLGTRDGDRGIERRLDGGVGAADADADSVGVGLQRGMDAGAKQRDGEERTAALR